MTSAEIVGEVPNLYAENGAYIATVVNDAAIAMRDAIKILMA